MQAFRVGRAAGAIVALAGVAQVAQAELVFGLTNSGNLISFDSASPQFPTGLGAVTGIVAGQTLRSIDFRPANGLLYGLSTSGTASQVYQIDLQTAVATPIGAGFTLTGNTSSNVSIDFNPVVDRIRIVTGNGINARAHPVTGALVLIDTPLAYAAGDPNVGATPLVGGIAYTNNVHGAAQTTLYAYDFINDDVSTIGGINGAPSPNGGQMFTVGDSGFVTANSVFGFDISGLSGTAYFNTNNGANDTFYTLNLGTGAITAVGSIGLDVADISVIPAPSTLALLGASGLVALRRRR